MYIPHPEAYISLLFLKHSRGTLLEARLIHKHGERVLKHKLSSVTFYILLLLK